MIMSDDINRVVGGFIAEVAKHRDMALNVFDGFAGLLKGMHERLTHTAEEIDRLERQRGSLREKLKAEVEDGRRQLDKLNLEVREAKRELERIVKQTARDKLEILNLLDSVAAKAVA
jgi:hypothetical protein